MHQTILVKRKADAVGKLVFASEAIAETLQLDSELVTALHPIGIKDPQVRDMMLLEAVANLITAVAIQEGAMKESTEVPAEEEPEAPVTVETSPAPTPEDLSLPSPVLEPAITEEAVPEVEVPAAKEPEAPAKKTPARKSRKPRKK